MSCVILAEIFPIGNNPTDLYLLLITVFTGGNVLSKKEYSIRSCLLCVMNTHDTQLYLLLVRQNPPLYMNCETNQSTPLWTHSLSTRV